MRPLVVIAIASVLVIGVLVAGGLFVRSYVRSSFLSEDQARGARALAFMALRIQIDEETGIRGYAAARDRVFLEPYDRGRAEFPPTLSRLGHAMDAMHLTNARTAVDDAIATNAQWQHEIATPLLTGPRADRDRVLARGKQLVDRYRTDLQLIQTAIVNEEAQIDADTQAAIDRIGLLVVGAVLAVALLGLGFGVQQSRLTGRLVVRAREAAEMRAAYEAEKRIADTLQEAFVLKTLPALSGITFSATYLPAADEANVGGDWYDCVQLSRDRVLFVIGDVAGHGLDAAVAMNHARQEVISAAAFDSEPGELLFRVNAELLRQRARMVTVACGYADARTFEFTVATAGHPPPLLVEPGRAPRLLQCGGVPLGVIDGATYASLHVQSVPGAVLVLYTDGALEYTRDVLAGERMLLDAVGRAVASGEPDIAASVRDQIFKGRRVGDDVAIMSVSFAASGANARERSASAWKAAS